MARLALEKSFEIQFVTVVHVVQLLKILLLRLSVSSVFTVLVLKSLGCKKCNKKYKKLILLLRKLAFFDGRLSEKSGHIYLPESYSKFNTQPS